MECPASLRREILGRLKLRNKLQADPFRGLIQQNLQLQERASQLEKDVLLARSANSTASSILQQASSQSNPQQQQSTNGGEGVAALETAEITRLKEELTQAYKRNSESSRDLLQMSQELKEASERLRLKDKEYAQMLAKMSEVEQGKTRSSEEMRDAQSTIAVLRSELQSLQLEYVACEEAVKRLTAENEHLVDRWVRKQNEEAKQLTDETLRFAQMKLSASQLPSSSTPQQQSQQPPTPSSPQPPSSDSLTASFRNLPSPASQQQQQSSQRNPSSSGLLAGVASMLGSLFDQQSPQSRTSFESSSARRLSVGPAATATTSNTGQQQTSSNTAQSSNNSNSSLFVNAASILDAPGGGFDSVTSQLPTKQIQTLLGHSSDVVQICYNVTGSLLVSCSVDKTARIYDSSTGHPKVSFGGATSGLNGVSISLNDDMILGCSSDNAARVWMVSGARLRHTLTGHVGKVSCGLFFDTDKKVITGSNDRTVKIWDLNKGYSIKTMFCMSSCNDCCLLAGGSILATAHADKCIRLWDLSSGTNCSVLDAIHEGQVTCVQASPDGKMVMSCGRDNVIHLMDPLTKNRIGTLKHSDYRNAVNWSRACFSPDSHYVAAGSANGSVFIWDTTTFKMITNLPSSVLPSVPAVCVTWHPVGHQLAVACKNNIDIWA